MNELLNLKAKICHLDLKENTIANLLTSANKVQEEIERLNNIIDELEKYLLEQTKDSFFRFYANAYLSKLYDLKEGKE